MVALWSRLDVDIGIAPLVVLQTHDAPSGHHVHLPTSEEGHKLRAGMRGLLPAWAAPSDAEWAGLPGYATMSR